MGRGDGATAPPRLIRGLAEGKADALSGRYLHAEHDADLDALAARADDIRQHDLNAIRLRRWSQAGSGSTDQPVGAERGR